MQRAAVRVIVGTAQVDVPLGVFAANQPLVFDGTQIKTDANYLPSALQDGDNVISSRLPSIAGATTVQGTGYWVYFGRTSRSIVANFVELMVTAAGSGAQTAELGLFSSPLPPNRTAQTLTRIVATGTIGSLTGPALVRNTADFNTPIAAGVHVWGGFRESLVTSRPALYGLTADMAEGRILSLAASGALTGGPFNAAIIAAAVTWQAPDLRFICT